MPLNQRPDIKRSWLVVNSQVLAAVNFVILKSTFLGQFRRVTAYCEYVLLLKVTVCFICVLMLRCFGADSNPQRLKLEPVLPLYASRPKCQNGNGKRGFYVLCALVVVYNAYNIMI